MSDFCNHNFAVIDRDENDDRIRTRERCINCDRLRLGCFAKRYSDAVDAAGGREAWGPVGVWSYVEVGSP